MQHNAAVNFFSTLCKPHVPLSNAQFADYCDLMMQAQALRANGKHEQASLVSRAANTILQSGDTTDD